MDQTPEVKGDVKAGDLVEQRTVTDSRPALYEALTEIVGDIGPIGDESARRTAAHMLRHYLGQPEPTEADPPIEHDTLVATEVELYKACREIDRLRALVGGRPAAPRIIGRERALIDHLASDLLTRAQRDHACTKTRETDRGNYFEALIHHDGEPTDRIARVTVELDRVESVEVDRD